MVQSAVKESLPETLFPREDSGVLQTEAVLQRPEDPLKPEPRAPTSAPLPLLSRAAKSLSPAAQLLCCCSLSAAGASLAWSTETTLGSAGRPMVTLRVSSRPG